MAKCQETAGLLFPTNCDQEATRRCTQCQKWVCDDHSRRLDSGDYCIRCVREFAKDRQLRHKPSMSHLRDDPYFYWYYWGSEVFGDDYRAEDYAIFDRPAEIFEPKFKPKKRERERDWEYS